MRIGDRWPGDSAGDVWQHSFGIVLAASPIVLNRAYPNRHTLQCVVHISTPSSFRGAVATADNAAVHTRYNLAWMKPSFTHLCLFCGTDHLVCQLDSECQT